MPSVIADYSVLYALQGNSYYGRAGAFRTAQPMIAVSKARDEGCHTLLDVGCGRGWMLDHAHSLDMSVQGLEIVESLCADPRVLPMKSADNLPIADATFDVVTCLDVLEHLLPAQVSRSISELFRVARLKIILSIPHWPCQWNGVETHLTVKPREWWENEINKHPGDMTNNFDERYNMSHIVVDLP